MPITNTYIFNVEGGEQTRCVICRFGLSSDTNVYKIVETQPTPNQLLQLFSLFSELSEAPQIKEIGKILQLQQPSKEESGFNNPRRFFSVSSAVAKKEDDEMAERWQKDAEGILLFVSPRAGTRAALFIIWNTTDRSILCHRLCTPWFYRPGPAEANVKQPGYLCIPSGEHI